MALTYTDRNQKSILRAEGRFQAVTDANVEVGDLLNFLNTGTTNAMQLADQSDSKPAQAVALERGVSGDLVWCAETVELLAPVTAGVGGTQTQVYFAASGDFLGSSLYLGESGKASSSVGSTYGQAVGYVLARERILLTVKSVVQEFEDDVRIVLGTGSDAAMMWSTGDADNHTLVIALGNSNQGLHITDLGAVATDWNIAATTHPNLYIHSNTTPATDYLRLGDHDGTTAYIDVVGGTTLAFEIAGATQMSVTAAVLNIVSGNTYQINATDVLSSTTLGSGVTASSLTSLGSQAETLDMNANLITNIGNAGLDFDSSGLSMNFANAGSAVRVMVRNSDTGDTASKASIDITTETGMGDPHIFFEVNGGSTWAIGNDNSASDGFAIANSYSLGSATHDAIRITTSEVVSFNAAQGSDYDYWCEGCGRTSRTAFECCGLVEWHDDNTALMKMRSSEQDLMHMAKIGVMDVIDQEDGRWVGINIQPAIDFTWSAMRQFYGGVFGAVPIDPQERSLRERIGELEQELAALKA
jgi:hypothetical protein